MKIIIPLSNLSNLELHITDRPDDLYSHACVVFCLCTRGGSLGDVSEEPYDVGKPKEGLENEL